MSGMRQTRFCEPDTPNMFSLGFIQHGTDQLRVQQGLPPQTVANNCSFIFESNLYKDINDPTPSSCNSSSTYSPCSSCTLDKALYYQPVVPINGCMKTPPPCPIRMYDEFA
jgi:hypothetical protein